MDTAHLVHPAPEVSTAGTKVESTPGVDTQIGSGERAHAERSGKDSSAHFRVGIKTETNLVGGGGGGVNAMVDAGQTKRKVNRGMVALPPPHRRRWW